MAMELPSTVKAQFLSNNDPLDPQYLDIAEARIKFLNQKINELGPELELEVAQYKLLLSPFRWLPLELIGEIFTLLFVGGAPCWEAKLIKLCLVCKRWRVAALLTPRLWSNTHIYLSHRPISFDSAVSWLNRSKNVSRTLVVEMAWKPRDAAPQETESEKDLYDILTRGPSIDTLKIECKERKYIHLRRLLKTFQGDSTPRSARPWDTIKTFSLTNCSSTWLASAIETESMYLDMPPAIESLTLHFPGRNGDRIHNTFLHAPAIFIGRLTALMLTCDQRGIRLFAILQQCINLESLVVDFRPNVFRLDGSLPRLILPKLTMLSVEQIHVKNIQAFFDCLRAPSLLYLTIQVWQPALDVNDDKWLGDLSLTAPPLLYLSVSSVPPSPTAVELKLMSRHLSLTYTNRAKRMSDPNFLPFLITFSLFQDKLNLELSISLYILSLQLD